MDFTFSDEQFDQISEALGVPAKKDGSLTRFELTDPESGRRLALEIHSGLKMPDNVTDRPANVVSVYATNSFLQLQGCTGLIASADLGEVIFFAKQGGSTNGLVVERGAGSSLYANVDDRILSADFTQVPPEVMMSTVALSMSEMLFSDFKDD